MSRAERIAVLRANSQTARLSPDAIGSVDKPEIQKLASDVLEGGHETFAKRQQEYGI